MKKHSKRYYSAKSLITKTAYEIDEGLYLLKKLSTANFIESVDCSILLNIDSKHAAQQLRGTVVLPHGTGNALKIAIVSDLENDIDFANSGAIFMTFEELETKISGNELGFKMILTSPAFIPQFTKYAKILGPKGLMPSLKSGTVSQNLKETFFEFSRGKKIYRADQNGIVHLNFGKKTFPVNDLKANLFAIFKSLESLKPGNVKGKFLRNVSVCPSMGPSLRLNLASLKKF